MLADFFQATQGKEHVYFLCQYLNITGLILEPALESVYQFFVPRALLRIILILFRILYYIHKEMSKRQVKIGISTTNTTHVFVFIYAQSQSMACNSFVHIFWATSAL